MPDWARGLREKGCSRINVGLRIHYEEEHVPVAGFRDCTPPSVACNGAESRNNSWYFGWGPGLQCGSAFLHGDNGTMPHWNLPRRIPEEELISLIYGCTALTRPPFGAALFFQRSAFSRQRSALIVPGRVLEVLQSSTGRC